MMKKFKRIKLILEKLPLIRRLIKDGYGWEVLQHICKPLELTDTAFRDNPNLNDFLVDEEYWKKRLLKICEMEKEIKIKECGICGGRLVLIRGKYPKDIQRLVCPTCLKERMEQIHEISNPNYGRAGQEKSAKKKNKSST